MPIHLYSAESICYYFWFFCRSNSLKLPPSHTRISKTAIPTPHRCQWPPSAGKGNQLGDRCIKREGVLCLTVRARQPHQLLCAIPQGNDPHLRMFLTATPSRQQQCITTAQHIDDAVFRAVLLQHTFSCVLALLI